MNIRITLCIADGDLTLFEGPVEDCPPIPNPGDLVKHESTSIRVEGVQHLYQEAGVEIQLLA